MGDVGSISRTATISATPQEIWDVLADFGALASWVDSADHSCVLNRGPDGALLGTTRRVQMGRNVLVERVTVAEEPAVLGYDISGLPRLLGRLANRWTLRPVGNATEVTITSTVDQGRNPIAGVTERVVCRVMATQSDGMLAALRRRMENTHG